MKIQITADSTCDLPGEVLARAHVTLAPLTVLLGDEAHRDGVDVTPQEIFAAVKDGRGCRTAAVNAYEYEKLFQQALETSDAVIHLNIGSSFSACHANALLAAKKFPGRVFPVDTQSLSSAMGLMVLDAAEMARAGLAPADILAQLAQETPLMDGSFVIQEVDYLYKGGRCSAVAAVGAKVLHLKPCIELMDGRMTVGQKYRGSLERCLDHYLTDKLADRAHIDFSRCIVVHSACSEALVSHFLAELDRQADFREVLVADAGSTISCHCGPNTLGVMFKRKTPKERPEA